MSNNARIRNLPEPVSADSTRVLIRPETIVVDGEQKEVGKMRVASERMSFDVRLEAEELEQVKKQIEETEKRLTR